MARKRKSTRRKSSSSRKVAFGTFLKRSKSKGKKLISVSRAGGRKVYKVKGRKTVFHKLGSAKSAANKIAYK